jgi:hypothetical protein
LGSIDLDPASNAIANATVKAPAFYTAEQNGLLHPWHGKIWCNPPYSAALIKKFTAKFLSEYLAGNMMEGIMLTNSGTDTQWNLSLAEGVQVYTIGRISFLQPDGAKKATGSRGQCFTYFGPNPSKFIEVFSRNNFCWVPNKCLISS